MSHKDSLMREIAKNAAEHAAQTYGANLPHKRKRALKRRYFDSAFAALIVYDEILVPRASRPARELLN
jgi:hypothetical protein